MSASHYSPLEPQGEAQENIDTEPCFTPYSAMNQLTMNMNEESKIALTKTKPNLCSSMQLCEVLVQMSPKGILTPVEIQKIQAKPTQYEQNCELIDLLLCKSQQHFFFFLVCLLETRQYHLATEIAYNLPDKNRAAQLLKECGNEVAKGQYQAFASNVMKRVVNKRYYISRKCVLASFVAIIVALFVFFGIGGTIGWFLHQCPTCPTPYRGPYLSDIKVVYGKKNPPLNSTKAWKIHTSTDINSGFRKARHVHLVPEWSYEKKKAISSIRIRITTERDDTLDNLVEGDGGKFRYLSYNRIGSAKICDLWLLRILRGEVDTVNDLPVDGHANDINYGRTNESQLYLIWSHECT